MLNEQGTATYDQTPPTMRKALENKERWEKAAEKGPSGARRLSYVWADDIEIDLNTSEVIGGLLSTTGLTVLYGESGCGKTFFTLDMACHVAAGFEWYDNVVEQGPVLYVAAEAPGSVEKRVKAWMIRHGVESLPLAVVQSSVDLLDGDTDAILDVGRAIEQRYGRVALVVIDTLARAMTGNENSSEDMGRFVDACTRIRDALGTHTLVVHHSGKDLARGARGHSSLRAASDVEIEVAAGDDKVRTAKVTKNRDGVEGTVFAFDLETVELGRNLQDQTVTTCVTSRLEGVTCHARDRAANRRPLGKDASLAKRALKTALEELGERPPPCDMTRDVSRAVTVSRWRLYFEQHYGCIKDDPKEQAAFRQAWKRGREALLGRNEAIAWGEWVWLAQ